MGAPKNLDIRCAVEETVGVREEEALERAVDHPKRLTQRRFAASRLRGLDMWVALELGEPLPECRAFDEGSYHLEASPWREAKRAAIKASLPNFLDEYPAEREFVQVAAWALPAGSR